MSHLTARWRRSANPFLSDFREIRLEKAKLLKELGQEPYAVRFEITHHASALQDEHKDLPNGEERLVEVSVAGRVLSRRVMGKLAFLIWLMGQEQFSSFWRRPRLNRKQKNCKAALLSLN